MAGTFISVSAASVSTPAENLDAFIKEVVDGFLNGVTWQQAEAGNLAVKVAQTLTQKLQEKKLPRKFVANTFIMQKKEAICGHLTAVSSLVNPKTDAVFTYTFESAHVLAVTRVISIGM